MRILLLYYSPWWNATAYYGVTLAEGLLSAGHTVWFGTDRNSPAWQKASGAGIECFPIRLHTNNPVTTLKEIRRLSRFIQSSGIEIVNTLSPQGHFFHAAGRLLFGIRAPLVRSCCDVRLPNRHVLNRYLYRNYVQRLIFPCNTNLKQYREILRFPAEKAYVIYPAIDVERYDSANPDALFREQYGINGGDPIVGIIARLSPEKGHDHFLKVAAKVAGKVENVYFIIAGKEEQVSKESLMKRAENLGILEKVVFTGYLNDPRGAVKEFSVGVITSRFSETICRAALEYFTAGIPVVATKVNVLSEIIIPGENGFSFEIDDVNGMADSIISLLSSAEMYERMRNKARETVVNLYNIKKFTAETVAVYEMAIDGTARE